MVFEAVCTRVKSVGFPSVADHLIEVFRRSEDLVVQDGSAQPSGGKNLILNILPPFYNLERVYVHGIMYVSVHPHVSACVYTGTKSSLKIPSNHFASVYELTCTLRYK